MRILLFILMLPLFILSQELTYVPDDNFEQELINLGYDDMLDNYVLTSSIISVTTLTLRNKNNQSFLSYMPEKEFLSLALYQATNEHNYYIRLLLAPS